MILETYRPFEKDRMPLKTGIYAFLYNPFNPLSLGIFKGKDISHEQCLVVRKVLRRKLDNIDHIKSLITSKINLDTFLPSGAAFFSSEAETKAEFTAKQDRLNELTDAELLNFVEFGNEYIYTAPPLYCGITQKQTLRQRFIQHEGNFHSKKDGTFGGRVSQTNIQWPDLIFICMPTSSIAESALTIDVLESEMIRFSNPLLSNR